MDWFKKFPSARQYDEMDCGPTCLQIICRYYKKKYSLDYLRKLCNTTRAGSSMLGLQEAAAKLRFDPTAIRIAYHEIDNDMLPCIAYWNQRHFVVIYKITNDKIYVSDPAHGLLTYNKKDFLDFWSADGENGILLHLDLEDDFFDTPVEEKYRPPAYGFKKLAGYLGEHKKTVISVFAFLLIMGVFQLAFPFITENLVDRGINQKQLNYIYVLLLAQFAFFLGRTMAEVFNTYSLLKLGTRLNIKLVSEFFNKLFRLPLGFFDIKMSGDILQRINDHSRIEYFLTHGALNIFLSFITMVIFGGVLFWYSPLIFIVFIVGSVLYVAWFRYFMKKKAELDYKNFSKLAERQEKNLEMIFGMPEIKLNNAGDKKHRQWQQLQEEVFQLNYRTLKITQWQQTGARILNEVKNIAITFLSAYLVLDDSISLGKMMSISYISGQLNAPVSSLLDFLQQYQDAQLSSQRVNEIHHKEDESNQVQEPYGTTPGTGDIVLSNVSFRYEKSSYVPYVLKNISLTIKRNRITAIVGQSGCGKTTLLKLLLKFYEPDEGAITVGEVPFANIPHNEWRKHCGTVLQDAYIFSETIAENITLAADTPDDAQLKRALKIANLVTLIDDLPLGLNTKIGSNGMQLSGGEKQRVLIARAVYNNPAFVFFDEATSALDAVNERQIVNNLGSFFENKTVVIIAHRLSTVQHADNIIVLDKGEVVETGTHQQLVALKGFYHTLVKNQLELNG